MTAAQKSPAPRSGRKPGRPRQLQDAPNHNTALNILAHARQLFLARSFSAVSINDIVAAAEVSKPTLYYYYPDKEHLYAAVLTELIEKAGEYFESVLGDGLPLREKLIKVAEGFFEHAPTSMPCLLRDVAQHLKDGSSDAVLKMYDRAVHQPFERIFAQAIKSGELKAANPRLLTELFLTMLDWLTLRFTCQQDPPLTVQEKARQVVALFLEGAAT